jgi:hypothetical protein
MHTSARVQCLDACPTSGLSCDRERSAPVCTMWPPRLANLCDRGESGGRVVLPGMPAVVGHAAGDNKCFLRITLDSDYAITCGTFFNHPRQDPLYTAVTPSTTPTKRIRPYFELRQDTGNHLETLRAESRPREACSACTLYSPGDWILYERRIDEAKLHVRHLCVRATIPSSSKLASAALTLEGCHLEQEH